MAQTPRGLTRRSTPLLVELVGWVALLVSLAKRSANSLTFGLGLLAGASLVGLLVGARQTSDAAKKRGAVAAVFLGGISLVCRCCDNRSYVHFPTRHLCGGFNSVDV